jgi:hypothetical protein
LRLIRRVFVKDVAVNLRLLIWTVLMGAGSLVGSAENCQAQCHPWKQPGQKALRWLGGGWSAGYHGENPGYDSRYYHPYSAHNSTLISPGMQSYPHLASPHNAYYDLNPQPSVIRNPLERDEVNSRRPEALQIPNFPNANAQQDQQPLIKNVAATRPGSRPRFLKSNETNPWPLSID